VHYNTCVEDVAHAVNVFHATLSIIGVWRAESETVFVFSTADIWRVGTKTAAEVAGALGAYFVEC
jgi:hypothetical protein